MSKILCVIPARGDSKGLKNKNILKFNNMPLIFWSIEDALSNNLINKVVVSSDSDEILNLCKNKFSNIICDKRPDHLALDTSKTIDVLNYLMKKYSSFDYVCLLQPTSPLREKKFVQNCCEQILENTKKDVLVSGYISHAYEYGTHQNKSRQELGGFFYDDGNVYIFKKSIILENKWSSKIRIEVINNFPYTIEIDSYEEFKALEILHKNYHEL